MADIHSSSVIHPDAKIHETAVIGPFCQIGENVEIGANVHLHASVVITGSTKLAESCEVFPGAVIGARPQVLGAKEGKQAVEIGARTIIRENATIHGASEDKDEPTRVGEDCYLMLNSHLGHDVQIGNKCVFAAGALVGGHARIGNQVWLGGMAGVHQNSWIGDHAFIAAGCVVTGDIIPFVVAEGTSCSFSTLNAVGLSRRGFSRADMKVIRSVIQAIFNEMDTTLLFKERVEATRKQFEGNEFADQILRFVEAPRSGRKLCPYKG